MLFFFKKKKEVAWRELFNWVANVPCVQSQQDLLFKFWCVGNFPDYIVMREMPN
jgi:hypothetical protein